MLYNIIHSNTATFWTDNPIPAKLSDQFMPNYSIPVLARILCPKETSVCCTSNSHSPTHSPIRLDDVRDGLEEEWLGVEFHSGPEGSDMFITIDDTRYIRRPGKETLKHGQQESC